VGMDYSTLPEVVGPAGVLVPVANLVENPYDHFWATPDEGAITAAVVRLARKPQERKSIGALGPNYVRSKFSWDHSAEQFAALIEARVNRQEVAA
jgi:glycosyltransferase involved in cell wall biosynthesis